MSGAASDSPNKKKPVVQRTEKSFEQPVFLYELIAGGKQKPSRR